MNSSPEDQNLRTVRELWKATTAMKGSDTDFVDIPAVCKGYFIRFNLMHIPQGANRTLSNKPIRISIDFLTGVTFIPAKRIPLPPKEPACFFTGRYSVCFGGCVFR